MRWPTHHSPERGVRNAAPLAAASIVPTTRTQSPSRLSPISVGALPRTAATTARSSFERASRRRQSDAKKPTDPSTIAPPIASQTTTSIDIPSIAPRDTAKEGRSDRNEPSLPPFLHSCIP